MAKAKPRTLDELRSALSEKARRGFDQQRETMSEENFRRLTDSFKDAEGNYDTARAEDAFAKREVSDVDFEDRLRQRKAQYTDTANKNIKKIQDVCKETDGTNRIDAKIGDGTSEAALVYETTTGKRVGGKGHAVKCSEAITALLDAISRLENVKQFITDTAKLAEIDAAIAQAKARISAMEPALSAWDNRVVDHPDVWNSDGTSKVTPDFP